MKPVPILIACLFACAHAVAQVPAYYGDANCRIAPLEPHPKDDQVDWSGGCKDGFADGPGVLTWQAEAKKNRWVRRKIEGTLVRGEVSGEAKLTVGDIDYIHVGTLKHGLADGRGYVKFADGGDYEGESREDEIDGYGRANFALGGSYEGEWKANKMEGKGRIVYAGSGRVYEGQFHDGHPVGAKAGETASEAETETFKIKEDMPRTGSNLINTLVTDVVPPNQPWEKLSPSQKDLVRSWYTALEDGDEPPYPSHGPGELHKVAVALRESLPRSVHGVARVHALVGTDGLAKSVSVLGSPDPKIAEYLAKAAMALQFKPAICHGRPCEMIYPVHYNFE